MGERIELRTYVFIDCMQPQYAAFLGTVSRGDVPMAGMAQLYLEISPGTEVYGMLDIALKSGEARSGFQDVEREFGSIELHSYAVDGVLEAGNAILSHYNLRISDKLLPEIVSCKIINNITPYQAQLINRFRQGSMIVPSESLLIMEVEPAVYITHAVNETEKHADIKIVHFDPVGRYGRLYVSGNESLVKTAMDAAQNAIASLRAK